jgi:hypothetical protein
MVFWHSLCQLVDSVMQDARAFPRFKMNFARRAQLWEKSVLIYRQATGAHGIRIADKAKNKKITAVIKL